MTTIPNIHGRRPAQAGFVLIEVLVGVLIFSLGVLGIVGLQAAMTQAQTAAKFRADAAYLASEARGVMWADTTNLLSYDTAANCASNARCTAWTDKVGRMLPGGTAVIEVSAGGNVTITISWTPPNEGASRYTTATSIRS